MNAINGGPVSEGKCLQMIANERETNIHEDLVKLEKVLRIFMREEIFVKLDEHEKFSNDLNKLTH